METKKKVGSLFENERSMIIIKGNCVNPKDDVMFKIFADRVKSLLSVYNSVTDDKICATISKDFIPFVLDGKVKGKLF